jgi:signal transduction histidine kinase
MKSIRLSLIVYFLVLWTGALGAVSWFSYRTTAHSLRERERDARKMIETQYEANCRASRADLDRRILHQAQALASMRLVPVNHDPLGGTGAVATALYPKKLHIESADALIVFADRDHPQDYFQTYGGKDGQPMQRSVSMGHFSFKLDKELHEKAPLFTEHFDEVELKPGVKVRRVTLKTPVSGFGGMGFFWPSRRGGPPSGLSKNNNPKGQPRPLDSKTPTLFIQYASDLGPIEEKINQFGTERDEQLADVNGTIAEDLRQLRSRMLWIALATMGAVWLGGYVVIRLGLAPLSKMSEAVSQISPKNFHLPLETEKLPHELRPIAERLVEVLQHLQKAFAREKQAAADISHELRTPLAALMTNLELGLRKTRSAEEYRDILDECKSSGQHMYQLVERLLTLARLDAGADQYRPKEADVTETALSCADLIRPLARARGLDLRLHMPDPITMVSDPDKLREVLTNLLHNAVEYNKPNGSIELSVERVNGLVRLEVRDTGIGIGPEVQEHIFKRFYRADPSRHADTPHAGLGLAIVKSYVDLMGGTIRVESSGAGTAFIIELPFVATAHDLATAVRSEPVLAAR